MNARPLTIGETRAQHPFPWTYSCTGGSVVVLDAKLQEVPLFVILDFAASVTAQLAAKAA